MVINVTFTHDDKESCNKHNVVAKSGVDAGFPVGGCLNPPVGREHMILSNFLKNGMKLRKFCAVAGRGTRESANGP